MTRSQEVENETPPCKPRKTKEVLDPESGRSPSILCRNFCKNYKKSNTKLFIKNKFYNKIRYDLQKVSLINKQTFIWIIIFIYDSRMFEYLQFFYF